MKKIPNNRLTVGGIFRRCPFCKHSNFQISLCVEPCDIEGKHRHVICSFCTASWAEQIPWIDDPIKSEMTNDQAEALLLQLREHFGDPVMPMERYCAAFRKWAELRKAVEPRENQEKIDWVSTQISKSSLLARLLYYGEELRTEKCPVHNGSWSGIFIEDECGCGGTGWLPNKN